MMAKKKTIDNNTINDATTFGTATYAGEMTSNYADATSAAFDGMELLRNKAEQIINVGNGQSQGHLFEVIEATKFNMDSAIKSSDLKAFVTDAEGRPHAAADVEIRIYDTVLREAQLKSYKNAPESLFAQSHDKYSGMQRVSPSDQFERMKELAQKRIDTGTLKAADYKDTVKNLESGLKHNNVSSSGTTRSEADLAAKNHKKYAADFKLKATVNETSRNMAYAAAAGGVIGGAISITRNIISVKTGETTTQEATLNIVKDIGSTSARSALTAGVTTIIKNTALDNGLGVLAKSNVATAVAVTTINVSKSIIKYTRGELTLEEMTLEMGKNGAQSVSGLYFGIAGGVVGGPVGVLVGSMAGYMIANISYQTVVDAIQSAKLANEQYEKLKPIYEESIAQMERMEKEFKQLMNQYFKETNTYIDKSFELINGALVSGDTEAMSIGIVNLVSVFGKKLEVMTYSEFNEFMVDDSRILKL